MRSYHWKRVWPRCWTREMALCRRMTIKGCSPCHLYVIWVQTGESQVSFDLIYFIWSLVRKEWLHLMWTGLLIGTLGCVSTDRWPTLWIIIEINLISFMPFITYNWSRKKIGIIYFLVQRIGSLIILAGGIITEKLRYLGIRITLALLLKNRLAPLHFWGAPLVTTLSNITACVFQTWQKIAPIFFLLLSTPKFLLWIILIINILVSSLCRMGSKSIFVLLFFSGMIHIRWLISAPIMVAGGYFLFYVISSLLLYFPIRTINQTLLILNLAGVPPLTGFWMKLVVLQQVRFGTAIALILAALPFLYAYVRLFLMAPISHGKPAIKTVVVCGLGCLL